VWGPPGIGKTHLVEQTRGAWLTEETLRSKQATIEFIERMRSADCAVIIDDFESVSDLVGFREITGCPSKGQMFITALAPIKLSFPVLNYELPVPSPEKIFKIVSEIRPNAPPDLVRKLASQAHGSIRFVLQGIEFRSDAPDNFSEPKHDLEVLLVKGVKGIERTMDNLHEHGYSWAVVQENYIDAPNLSLEQLAHLADAHSIADVIDEHVYRTQTWDLLPYLCNEGIFRPVYFIKKTLKKLRPGSLWTKYQNMCMKKKRIEAICEKIRIKDPEYFPVVIARAADYPALTAQDISFMKKICTLK
jgi:hypothetical protein